MSVEPRDMQRSKVYKWTRKSFPALALSEDECSEIINKICLAYDVPKRKLPKITFTNSDRLDPGFNYETNEISLHNGHKHLRMCLHEAVHAVLYHYYKLSKPWHGAEFVYLMCFTAKKLGYKVPSPGDLEYSEPSFLRKVKER